MENTSFKITILLFWLASMVWLVATKMLPISAEPRPSSGQYFATPETDTASGRWRISAQEQEVGWTDMRALRLEDGGVAIQTELELKDLKLDNLAKELFSGWTGLLKYVRTPDSNMAITLRADTDIRLSSDGALEEWDMKIGLADSLQQIRILGIRQDEQVSVRLSLVGANSVLPAKPDNVSEEQLFRTKIRLPRAALVVDAFTPQPRLANLRVGDRWRFKSFQSFPPSSQPHVVEAKVERTELMVWDSDIQSTFVVHFRDISGNRPTVSEGAYSTLWVLGDGTVIKQLTRFASLELGFERVPIRQFATESK